MQHDPWVETMLQTQLKGKNVSFRNMSFSGDMVNKRPRNKGFTNDAEYLQHVAPDVVFRSTVTTNHLRDRAEQTATKPNWSSLVQRYTELRKEKGKDLRFVLFSPIAYQNLGDPNLPDGTELNKNLAWPIPKRHGKQRSKRAQHSLTFTHPPNRLFESSAERFTVNGIHLNANGYRKLSDIISGNLLGETVSADLNVDDVYEAVKEKNWHWHNRYHATDW